MNWMDLEKKYSNLDPASKEAKKMRRVLRNLGKGIRTIKKLKHTNKDKFK